MAKTSYVQIAPGLEEAFLKGLKSGDRFQFSKVVRNDSLLSRRRKVGVSARSLLPILSAQWALLATGGTDWGFGLGSYGDPMFGYSDANLQFDWNVSAGMMGLKGWQLFVQDTSIRIKNDLSGLATPTTKHQSWVGKIVLGGAATEIKLIQIHPKTYWVIHKVYRKKGMYEPLKITENFGLPLQIGLSYKTALTAAGDNPQATFYAKIWNSYQGQDDATILPIDIPLTADWTIATATLSSLRGIIVGYELFIHLKDVTGAMYFDNIKAVHNAQNWARDPFCKQVAVTFTHAFQQIPKHWAAEILPDGAEYDSVYEDF